MFDQYTRPVIAINTRTLEIASVRITRRRPTPSVKALWKGPARLWGAVMIS